MRRITIPVFALILSTGFRSIAQCDSIDLAFGKRAYASSLENGTLTAANAFDGDTTGTRWGSAFSDTNYIFVDLGVVYNLCEVKLFWEAALGRDFNIDISNDSTTWTTVAPITGNSSFTNTISISGSGRYVRMYGTRRGTGFGYSLYEMEVFGTPSSCSGTNIALNQPTVASSFTPPNTSPNAVDGNFSTRWESTYSDPQYIYVDLGSITNFCSVALYWEAAFGSSYNIDVSNDASTWTTLDSVHQNAIRTNLLSITGSGRYLRMYGLTRATSYGYSIYEFQVYSQSTLPIKLVDFEAKKGSGQDVSLTWTTDIETNNSYFSIERSAEGVKYMDIGHVPGSGSSSTPKNYKWTDSLPQQGLNYYRLKQVDLDGNFTYSTVVTIDMGSSQGGSGFSIYPNPATDQVHIVSPRSILIREIDLYNTAGMLVQKYSDFSEGSNAQINAGGLPKGIYTVKIVTDNGVSILRLMK